MKHERVFSRAPLTDADRLRFAVRFAVMNLDALRPGDWLNLCDDVFLFLVQPPQQSLADDGSVLALDGSVLAPAVADAPMPQRLVFGIAVDRPTTPDAFKEALRALQPVIHAVLDAMAYNLDEEPLRTHEPLPSPEVQFWPLAFYVLLVKGTLRDVFLWHVFALLKDAPVDKVMRCRECQTIFYRVKQQMYCSRSCTNRFSQRRFRERREAAATA